jgi:hypothetical protein
MHTVIYEKTKQVINRVFLWALSPEGIQYHIYLSLRAKRKPTNDYYLPAITAGWGR